jgi:hypothetical protein
MWRGSFFDNLSFIDESEEIFMYDSATLPELLRYLICRELSERCEEIDDGLE